MARVLIIDDDETSATLMSYGLWNSGHHTEIAASGKQGLLRAVRNPADLGLLDNNLPDANDLDVCRSPCDRLPGCPIIMVTGAGNERLVAKMARVTPELPIILRTGFSEQVTPERVCEAGVRAAVYKPLCRAEMTHAMHAALGGDGATSP